MVKQPRDLTGVVFHESCPFYKFIPIEKIGFLRYLRLNLETAVDWLSDPRVEISPS